jgi:hypothetical protein
MSNNNSVEIRSEHECHRCAKCRAIADAKPKDAAEARIPLNTGEIMVKKVIPPGFLWIKIEDQVGNDQGSTRDMQEDVLLAGSAWQRGGGCRSGRAIENLFVSPYATGAVSAEVDLPIEHRRGVSHLDSDLFGWRSGDAGCRYPEACSHIGSDPSKIRAKAQEREVLGLGLEHDIELQTFELTHHGNELEGIIVVCVAGEQRRQQNNFSLLGFAILPFDFAQFRAGRGKMHVGGTYGDRETRR